MSAALSCKDVNVAFDSAFSCSRRGFSCFRCFMISARVHCRWYVFWHDWRSISIDASEKLFFVMASFNSGEMLNWSRLLSDGS